MRELAISSSSELREAYRQLLREEWSGGSLSRASDLVQAILSQSGLSLHFEWDAPRTDDHQIQLTLSPLVWQELASFSEKFFLGKRSPFPAFGDHVGDEAPAVRRIARRIAAQLNVQSISYLTSNIVLTGETGFLRDCQSTLTLMSVSELIPILREDSAPGFFDAFVESLRLHIAQVWSDDFPHQAFLVGAVTSHLEIDDLAAGAFRFAFRASNSDDHDYLTKAHAVWFSLHDAGRSEEARHFLLNLARASTPEQLPEIESMIEHEFGSPPP
jgi:hypothetical protein